MRVSLFTLISFTLVMTGNASAGTSIQDVEVFRLRNSFGNSERKVEFQLANSREQLVYTYNCLYRSAQLDDFSSSESQYAITRNGGSYVNEAQGFTKYIEVGVYHPDDHVGFKAMATPGEIQEVEIFRIANDKSILIERVLVSAPHSLSDEGQKRWRHFQQVYEPAVSFHEEKPGNERWQGLVTGYTVCAARNITSDYNPVYTHGAHFKRGSVVFYETKNATQRFIQSGELAEPWTLDGVTYVGNVSFLFDGLLHEATLQGEQIIGGIPFTGKVKFEISPYTRLHHLSDATLARAAAIGDRVYKDEIRFDAPNGDHRWVVSFGNLAQPAKVGRHVFIGKIQYALDSGQNGERVINEDVPSWGWLAEPFSIGGVTLNNAVGFHVTYDNNLRITSYSIEKAYTTEALTLANGANIRAGTYINFGGEPAKEFVSGAQIANSWLSVTNESKCEFYGQTYFYQTGRVTRGTLASDCTLHSRRQRSYITYKARTTVDIAENGEVRD